MPPASTETDNYKLLFYLINQLEKKGLINKNINWDEVAAALNAKVGTVQKRWQVLKKKEHIGQDDALLDADDEEEDDAKPKKPATRKKRTATSAATGEPKAKKGKTAAVEDELPIPIVEPRKYNTQEFARMYEYYKATGIKPGDAIAADSKGEKSSKQAALDFERMNEYYVVAGVKPSEAPAPSTNSKGKKNPSTIPKRKKNIYTSSKGNEKSKQAPVAVASEDEFDQLEYSDAGDYV